MANAKSTVRGMAIVDGLTAPMAPTIVAQDGAFAGVAINMFNQYELYLPAGQGVDPAKAFAEVQIMTTQGLGPQSGSSSTWFMRDPQTLIVVIYYMDPAVPGPVIQNGYFNVKLTELPL